jgi:hypothetical protein
MTTPPPTPPTPPPTTPVHAWRWWTALGVVATIVLGVLQIAVACRQDRQQDPQSATLGSPTQVAPAPGGQSSSATPAATTPGAAPASPPPAGTQRWRGTITFIEGERSAFDLDLFPPRHTDIDDEGDINAGGLSSMMDTYGWVSNYRQTSRIAVWTGGAALPDFAACRETALARGANEVGNVRAGTVLCVETSEHRYARIEIIKVLKFSGYNANAVVWNA